MARRLTSGALLGLLVALSPASSGAVGFSVDSTVDAVDADPGDRVCASASDGCTLRAAIMETNALPGPDHISLPAGTYVLTLPHVSGADEATGDLDVTDAVTRAGGGAGDTVIDQASIFGVLSVRCDFVPRGDGGFNGAGAIQAEGAEVHLAYSTLVQGLGLPQLVGPNVETDGSCGEAAFTALLGPLHDNGGPTPTHALLAGGSAIDAIPAADCSWDEDSDPVTPEVLLAFDQRGEARPVGTGCDIGAVEVPEPAHALMLVTGALVLAAVRRRRREMFANSPRRVAPRRQLLVLAALLVALPAGAVTIDWVPIGNAGNAPDTATNCLDDAADCGSVPYGYYISKYEVTNAQYAEFLNAVAASDPFSLYNEDMGPTQCLECTPRLDSIRRSGSSGSYTYTATPGSENKPVFYVSFWDAVRFANWLNNGQGSGDTETGAYTITAAGVENNTITRNEEATVVLPTENEWYKAAYYSPGGTYFDYPTGTDAETACVAPAADTGNSANCDTSSTFRELTDVGAYGLSVSPYGTFDQAGNVWEWNEQIAPADIGGGSGRGVRGGTLGPFGGASNLTASTTAAFDPTIESVGFRVAALVPEPAQAFLALTGGLVLAAARRQRRA